MPSVVSSRQAIGMISILLNGVLFPKSALQYRLTKLWKRTPFLNQTKLFNSLSFWQHKAVAGWSWRVHCPWLYKTKEVVASSDQRVTRSYNLQSSSFSHVSYKNHLSMLKGGSARHHICQQNLHGKEQRSNFIDRIEK